LSSSHCSKIDININFYYAIIIIWAKKDYFINWLSQLPNSNLFNFKIYGHEYIKLYLIIFIYLEDEGVQINLIINLIPRRIKLLSLYYSKKMDIQKLYNIKDYFIFKIHN
jgi:hypothetical protein